MRSVLGIWVCTTLVGLLGPTLARADADLREEARAAMRRAAAYYHDQVATHGGYVYFYAADLNRRWGEGEATAEQIWVQPPGTPTVGLAYLSAWRATGDDFYLDAATDAAEALVFGQLQSGAWTNAIDFDPKGARVSQYRNGKARGRNFSTLDDGISQSALRLLMAVDQAHRFRHEAIHESVQVALDALLAAQFVNGAFPQGWDSQPPTNQPILKASYPDYDWQTEGRIKEYWNMYTLNDNVTGYVAEALIDAHRIYDEVRYLQALRRLGDFLILAQMPEPQPGWAQQYNYQMNPIWARKFEPPGVSGDETQEVLETLMMIYRATGDEKYLEPIPAALAWLTRSQLADGRLARYYELKTNRPLYMQRRGDVYTLTYDDSNLPDHYGWKTAARIDSIEQTFDHLRMGDRSTDPSDGDTTEADVRAMIDGLDAQGRWVSVFQGELLIGDQKFTRGMSYISSEVFSRNLTRLSAYVSEQK